MRACRLKQLPGFQTLKDGIKFQRLSKLLEAFREVAKCKMQCRTNISLQCCAYISTFLFFFPTLQFPKTCI